MGSISRTGKVLLASISAMFASGCYVAFKEVQSNSLFDVAISTIFLFSMAVMLCCAAAIILRLIAASGVFKGVGMILSYLPSSDPLKAVAENLERQDKHDLEETIRRATYNAAVDFKIKHGDRK